MPRSGASSSLSGVCPCPGLAGKKCGKFIAAWDNHGLCLSCRRLASPPCYGDFTCPVCTDWDDVMRLKFTSRKAYKAKSVTSTMTSLPTGAAVTPSVSTFPVASSAAPVLTPAKAAPSTFSFSSPLPVGAGDMMRPADLAMTSATSTQPHPVLLVSHQPVPGTPMQPPPFQASLTAVSSQLAQLSALLLAQGKGGGGIRSLGLCRSSSVYYRGLHQAVGYSSF